MPVLASEELRALLAEAELGVPPIPASFEPQLVRVAGWHFATPSAPRLSPYCFRDHQAAAKREDATDSLVIGHAGHGINSYALSYYLVLGSIRVLFQLQHGGVYMNHDETAPRIRAVFGVIEQNLSELERRAARTPVAGLYSSDFYTRHRDRLEHADDFARAVAQLCSA